VSDENATGNETFPAIARSATADGYVAVWSEHAFEGVANIDINGQRVTPQGRRSGSNFTISRSYETGLWGMKGQQNLVSNPLTNHYLVVWSDNRDFDTRHQHLRPTRQRLTHDQPVGQTASRGSETARTSRWWRK
jgi:hypothetical protein